MPANPFAPNSQAGKVAVVTGASSGIGRATVQQLTATGWNVYALARRAERLAILEAETGAHPITCDVTDEAAVRAAAKNILAETGGRVNALVNIAGGAIGLDRVADGSPEDYLAMYRVNVLGILNTVRAFIPALRASGEGSILNLTSTAAEGGYEGGAGYNAAKFGARGLTEALRLEEADNNLRVIEIRPGMVHTEEFSLNRLGSAEMAAKVYEGVEKPLVAEDVAQTVVFALNVPHHVNLDCITLRPVAQASQFKVIRNK
jgi:possible serine 3-dehydrogenase